MRKTCLLSSGSEKKVLSAPLLLKYLMAQELSKVSCVTVRSLAQFSQMDDLRENRMDYMSLNGYSAVCTC